MSVICRCGVATEGTTNNRRVLPYCLFLVPFSGASSWCACTRIMHVSCTSSHPVLMPAVLRLSAEQTPPSVPYKKASETSKTVSCAPAGAAAATSRNRHHQQHGLKRPRHHHQQLDAARSCAWPHPSRNGRRRQEQQQLDRLRLRPFLGTKISPASCGGRARR